MSRLKELWGEPWAEEGLWLRAFVPLPPTTPWRKILATRTVEGESGLYWCRMRAGPPNMEGGQNERNGVKFRVGSQELSLGKAGQA